MTAKKPSGALKIIGWGMAVMFMLVVGGMHFLSMPTGGKYAPPGSRAVCRTSLSQIGKAFYSYQQNNDGFLPYDERGPLHSLALLYPQYFATPKSFVCPFGEGDRRGTKNSRVFPEDTPLAGARCDYGYTWHVSRDAHCDFPIVADMPGNHDAGGFNVLSFGGYVHWETNPFLAHNPADNIFAPELGWSPDTDAWIRQQ